VPSCGEVGRFVFIRRRNGWQPHDEFASLAGPLARRSHAAAVLINETMHECEADTETALSAVQRTVDLREQIEDRTEHVRGNADARVANSDHRGAVFLREAEGDISAGIGVFRGVSQEVRDDLREPGGIAVHPDGVRRVGFFEMVAGAIDERPARFHRAWRAPPPGSPAPSAAESSRMSSAKRPADRPPASPCDSTGDR